LKSFGSILKDPTRGPILSRLDSGQKESNISQEESNTSFYKKLKSWLPLPRTERVENDYKKLRSKSQTKPTASLVRIIRRGSLSPSRLTSEK